MGNVYFETFQSLRLMNIVMSMKEQCKSTTLLDLQIFLLHKTSFGDIGQLSRTHMLVMMPHETIHWFQVGFERATRRRA